MGTQCNACNCDRNDEVSLNNDTTNETSTERDKANGARQRNISLDVDQ